MRMAQMPVLETSLLANAVRPATHPQSMSGPRGVSGRPVVKPGVLRREPRPASKPGGCSCGGGGDQTE
jgi:hypothetical protein